MYKSMAVAYDGSDGSKIAFDKALEIKKNFPDIGLSIIYVNEESSENISFMDSGTASAPVTSANVDGNYAQFMPYGVGNGVPTTPEDQEEVSRDFSKHMHNSIQQQLDAKGVEGNVLALEGTAAKTIPAFIDEQNIELLVIGNSGKSGLQKFFLGSVSKKLLKEADCSILVVK